MAKPELGTKRVCGSCGAKFYDLMRDPIVCPKCEAVFKLAETEKAAPETESADEPEKAKAEEAVAEAPVEVVSLEEIEENGDDIVTEDDDVAAAQDIPEIEDEGDVSAEGEEDGFLESDEDEDSGDVTKILGDVPGKSEET